MEIELDPPHGLTGFPLGMPADALKAAAAVLGRVKVYDEGSASRFSSMKLVLLHEQFEIVFHLEDGRTVTAAEVWIPRPGPEDITVRFRGVDVFRTPALQLLDRWAADSLTLRHDEPSYWHIPKLSLGLTRTAGHEVPLDADGEPLYFQAVLVGPQDYYEALEELRAG